MNKVRFGLKALVAIAIIAAILLVAPSIGRFVPTHKIEQPVFCGSCHPEQVEELAATSHLSGFVRGVDYAYAAKNSGNKITAADAISKACQMCHNYWENFKWFGVKNFNIDNIAIDVPNIADLDPINGRKTPTDIYGNAVSPYGLASTQSFIMNVSKNSNVIVVSNGGGQYGVVAPWMASIDVYEWTNITTGEKWNRLDYVWSRLSALSPGPVGYRVYLGNSTIKGCGTAEKGMCHIAVDAITTNKKEFSEYPNANTGGINNKTATTLTGTGVFFTHEMAFTTAQYAAKPVKICGACHVFKLPPMRWGGEPWAIVDIETANENGGVVEYTTEPFTASLEADPSDPFGFRPSYNDLVGEALFTYGSGATSKEWRVAYRTPDWAHANVPCIRCHAHAGINGVTVSENTAGSPAGTPLPPYEP